MRLITTKKKIKQDTMTQVLKKKQKKNRNVFKCLNAHIATKRKLWNEFPI